MKSSLRFENECCRGRLGHLGHALVVAALACCIDAVEAGAVEMTSPSFRSLGGHVSAGGSGALLGATVWGGGSAGQLEAIGLTGAPTTLTTQAAGFWPIVQGGLPSLDLDGDGVQAFFDLDDDEDGLLDVVETGTGVFVSPTDTGSDPLDPDSDGDGIGDGAEVAAGSDPNVPKVMPAVPVSSLPGVIALVALLAAGGSWPLFRRVEER